MNYIEAQSVQAALPNMKSFLRKDERRAADQATFFSAVSYKLDYGSGEYKMTLEPKLTYRGVNGHSNMWDLSTSISTINDRLMGFGMYHNNKSMTLGFGFKYFNGMTFQAIYSTAPSVLRGNLGDSFELGLKIRSL